MSVGPGTVLASRYELVAPLGRGGMGAVYDALDRRLQRRVAVKVLLDELVEDPTLALRFEREAQAAARVAHPGIAQIYDYGTSEGARFIVMEYVDGRTLGRVLAERGALPVAQAVPLLTQLLSALSAAHALGVIHRDLKPGNVMIVSSREGDRVELIDFGIAHLKESEAYTRLTQTGMIVGTPSYMAPEQGLGRPADARTDVYSVGVLAFAMLTGQKPFAYPDLSDVVRAAQLERPPRIDALVPTVPAALAELIARALEKDPALRPASAAEFLRALTHLDAQTATVALPKTVASAPVGVPSWALWAAAGVVGLGLFAVLGIGAMFALTQLLTARVTPSFGPSPELIEAAQRVSANDYAGCLEALRGAVPSEEVLGLRMSCAVSANDRAELEATCALLRDRYPAHDYTRACASMLAVRSPMPMPPPIAAPVGPAGSAAPQETATTRPVALETTSVNFDDDALASVIAAARPALEACAVPAEHRSSYTLVRFSAGGGGTSVRDSAGPEDADVVRCIEGALGRALNTLPGGLGIAEVTVSSPERAR